MSIQVGLPRTIAGEPPWLTSIYKAPVDGAIWLQREHLDGDRQADLRVHGGVDKAVCVYAVEHFETWRIELGIPDIGPGAFGENFSVSGQVESTVCVGDVYRIGSSTVQVSQPRGPCWKVARRWHRPDLTRRVLDTGRTGWYLRVLSPCLVVPGDMIDLIERPHPEWTIQRTNNLSYVFETSAEARRALTTCTALADAWRASLRE